MNRAFAAALGLAAFGLAASAPANPPLRAMRWLAPGTDAAVAMTRAPPECLTPPPVDPDAAWRIEVGRAAFRTPLLLGGQAARAGVMCETCHRSGRTNRDFDFPGLSGPPGTADVTSSLFSSHRGDGVDNPRPIPDLGGQREVLRVSQAPQGRALESFIDGLITQEFDGAEPPPAVLDGLAAYVRALSPQACPRTPSVVVTSGVEVDNARRALAAAEGALQRSDRQTAILLVGAARSALGRLDERYAPPELARERGEIHAADLGLSAILSAIRAGDADALQQMIVWRAESGRWAADLQRRESRSYFNARRLASAAAQPPPAARPAAAAR